ncbi:STAS/SEC14 domain-containing protein [Salinispira pacifica]|uniref:STAS/SEC14 domain-containing protein n=1 Tax=Salinispira pacifica TaxID=1307761 RepID=V5WM94_9SPIO|nr:STAS/SEC14 domain-containing protein [Salinispira pacifica]AHC16768.1 hypothetical protein L21SP2_3430 [Salinispira pacifica]
MTIISVYYTAKMTDADHKELLEARLADIRRVGDTVNLLTVIEEGFESNAVRSKNERNFSKEVNPYVRKSAVVGATGMMKVTVASLKMFSKREIQEFDNETSATAWLRDELEVKA